MDNGFGKLLFLIFLWHTLKSCQNEAGMSVLGFTQFLDALYGSSAFFTFRNILCDNFEKLWI